MVFGSLLEKAVIDCDILKNKISRPEPINLYSYFNIISVFM